MQPARAPPGSTWLAAAAQAAAFTRWATLGLPTVLSVCGVGPRQAQTPLLPTHAWRKGSCLRKTMTAARSSDTLVHARSTHVLTRRAAHQARCFLAGQVPLAGALLRTVAPAAIERCLQWPPAAAAASALHHMPPPASCCPSAAAALVPGCATRAAPVHHSRDSRVPPGPKPHLLACIAH